MQNDPSKDVIKTTQAYYNSDDAQVFYYRLWGGEDLHLGIYEREDEPIRDASRRTRPPRSRVISNGS